jgi:hypothetical protein
VKRRIEIGRWNLVLVALVEAFDENNKNEHDEHP